MPGDLAPVSVVVITQNEERLIEKCLASVDWAAERIVVDAFSHDRTAEVAERAGARVVQRAWNGFASQKAFAVSLATQPWILNIDSDEQVTPELAAEIRELVRLDDRSESAFSVHIPLYFMGRELGHYGRSRQDPGHIRFFRRGRARYDDAIVHERLVVDGEVGWLTGKVFHDSYPEPAIASYWQKIRRYAELEAQQRALTGSSGSRWFRPIGKLGWMLFARGGILDGPPAWIWIAGQSYMEWRVAGRARELLRSGKVAVGTDAI
jgi:glycosyltransferase involved in cell wall biosynthesis